MRVMVIVKATAASESGQLPDPELIAQMERFNQELAAAGVWVVGEGLHPSARGVRLRFSGKERTLQNGPFAATDELVAGFWVWKVASMEEAIEWVRRCPNPMPDDSEIEIRPLYEEEDFQ